MVRVMSMVEGRKREVANIDDMSHEVLVACQKTRERGAEGNMVKTAKHDPPSTEPLSKSSLRSKVNDINT